jgi:putative endonuclease
MMWPFSRRQKPLGERGEDVAVRHLRRAGYRILGRNIRLNRCEVDIIARKGDTTVFVEVKTRRSAGLVDPVDNVSESKRRNIRRVAKAYIRREGRPGDYYRFDIITVVWPVDGKPSVMWYEDAFPDK